MIKRELYMNRIRPFIGGELIKVMTGIRRSGKSVMLELIKEELAEAGVAPSQMISINFEDMRYSHLQTATALHDEIIKRAEGIEGKAYLFFDEIQEVEGWEKCVNSLRVALDCDNVKCSAAHRAGVLPHADFVADLKGANGVECRKFHFLLPPFRLSVAPGLTSAAAYAFSALEREGRAVPAPSLPRRELPVPPRPPGRTSGTRRRGRMPAPPNPP